MVFVWFFVRPGGQSCRWRPGSISYFFGNFVVISIYCIYIKKIRWELFAVVFLGGGVNISFFQGHIWLYYSKSRTLYGVVVHSRKSEHGGKFSLLVSSFVPIRCIDGCLIEPLDSVSRTIMYTAILHFLLDLLF